MRKWFALALTLAFICTLSVLSSAESTGDINHEGYSITPSGIDIYLWENASTGYQWSYEVDDPTVLTCESDEVLTTASEDDLVGAASMHVWRHKAGLDGEALLSFYYERAWEGEEDDIAPVRTLCFSISVEGGKVIDCEMEDLSEDNEGDGGESVVTYEGETGGVDLEIFSDMTQQQTEEGTLFTSADGLTTMLINYEPEDDPEQLFEELKDEESAALIYDDPENGQLVISCGVDRDVDVPCVTMVYYTKDGIAEYTGYQAPNGGVLHVHTNYFLGGDTGTEEMPDADLPPEEDADIKE